MAMTGTGTQADPYIVGTWDELVTACGSYSVYVRLGTDIDMNDEYPEGLTTYLTINCTEIDGDGNSILNLRYTGDYLISTSNTSGVCKNLNFKNMWLGGEAQQTCFIRQPSKYGVYTFSQCSFSGRFEGDSTYKAHLLWGYVLFNNCSFNLQMQNYSDMLYAHDRSTYAFMYYCNIKLTGDTAEPLYMILKNSYVTGSVPNANVFADAQNSTERGLYSVLDIEAGEFGANAATTLVLANSDKCSTISGYLTPVTTAQLTNATYLASIGFPIQT